MQIILGCLPRVVCCCRHLLLNRGLLLLLLPAHASSGLAQCSFLLQYYLLLKLLLPHAWAPPPPLLLLLGQSSPGPLAEAVLLWMDLDLLAATLTAYPLLLPCHGLHCNFLLAMQLYRHLCLVSLTPLAVAAQLVAASLPATQLKQARVVAVRACGCLRLPGKQQLVQGVAGCRI